MMSKSLLCLEPPRPSLLLQALTSIRFFICHLLDSVIKKLGASEDEKSKSRPSRGGGLFLPFTLLPPFSSFPLFPFVLTLDQMGR
ncbi:hypothetical protein SCLCIDRAFT_1206795 [Scleroderma citrinum Foug A]|uniref:Uncharacterized protein n=1 Tax=Scleroderma citrinum Foug A TaxID=1036808 RepID=A0A0C3B086_9AGAM|nr:hypothetical protein SCLCIDRAFT_1206795 [Scleroderma citrinum Foug A]